MNKIFILLLLSANLNGLAQSTSDRIDSALHSLYDQGKISGNFLVAEKGKIIYEKSFGYANEKTKTKLNLETIFELASCSKQFTAMAILQLQEKKKLNLKDKLATYIPELSFYSELEIQHLVNHTSGLPDYMHLMDSLYDKSKIATNKDIIQLFAKYKPSLKFKANEQFQYSNTNYALLASVIEKASGQKYADYLEQHIFNPLGMKHTFIYTRRYEPKQVDNYAFGYLQLDSTKEFFLPDDIPEFNMVIWLDGIVGDGTVNSTLHDLLLWDRALYTNKLLSKSSMKNYLNTLPLLNGKKNEYSNGWFVEQHAEIGTIASHTGGWPGYNSYIERDIDRDKTIIMLQNHDYASLPIQTIRRILYNLKQVNAQQKLEISLTKDQLKEYMGVYTLEEGADFTVTLDEKMNQLYVQLTGQNPLPVYAEATDKFFLKVVKADIIFKRDEQGAVKELVLYQGGGEMHAPKNIK